MPTLVNNLRAIRGPITSVPLVAGTGVILEPDTENNQIIVKADETILWEGEQTSGNSVQLSEPASGFEYIEAYGDTYTDWVANGRPQLYGKCECTTNYSRQLFGMYGSIRVGNGNLQQRFASLEIDGNSVNISQGTMININTSGALTRTNTTVALRRIVGVNRKS